MEFMTGVNKKETLEIGDLLTGSYEGTETLDRKLKRIMEQNAADDETDITEDADE